MSAWLQSVSFVVVLVSLLLLGFFILRLLREKAQRIEPLNIQVPTSRVARYDAKTGKLIPLNEPHMALAVLLFDAPSEKEEDVIAATGISSDVIRYVGTVPDIRVNSRPTAFSFRSGNADIAQIAEQLNVRYVLAGSLQRKGDLMEVVAQLTDIETGGQIWSQLYRQPEATMFEVQRDIARRIVGAVLGEVKLSETLFAETTPIGKLDAWGLMNKAYYFWLTTFTPEGILEACNYLRQAIDIQPDYANARAALAMLMAQQMTTRICKDYDLCAEAASELIETAIGQSPDDIEVLENAGVTWQNLGERERAQEALRRVVELAPLNLIARGYLALLLALTGGREGADEARDLIEDNFATAPKHPAAPYWNYFMAMAEQNLGNHEHAIKFAQLSLRGQPGWVFNYYLLANSQCLIGQVGEAAETLAQARNLSPYLNAKLHVDNLLRICGSRDAAMPFIEGLEKEGFTEVEEPQRF